MPGGVVDEGEEYLDAAIREVEEEIGLRLPPDSLKLAYTSTDFYDNQNIIRFLYYGYLSGDVEVFLSSEHDEYYWLAFDEAIQRFDHPVWLAGLRFLKDHPETGG